MLQQKTFVFNCLLMYMGKIVVYTAIFGDFDILKAQPKQTIDCEFVCFTDNPKIYCEAEATRQFNIILCPTENRHPRIEAKRYRTHPSEVFGRLYPDKFDFFVYMDWSARLKSEHAIADLMKEFDDTSDLLVFKHPERDCIFDEAEFTANAKMKKYFWLEKKMLDQVAYYKKQGMPEMYWLSATWLIVSKNNKKSAQFLSDWRNECIKWTYQDQLSFDYLVRKNTINCQRIKDKNLRNNDLIDFLYPHRKRT